MTNARMWPAVLPRQIREDQHRKAEAHRVHPVLLEQLHLLQVLPLGVAGVLLLHLLQLGLDAGGMLLEKL